ncbi:putative universal stress protein [Dinoroseobacter shibae DFL 12 = DSM 16493]|jgi:nucleotide-binding universal stress UspA family protein|uniref:Putative universal stress protein n=1 Tax=Dinoroseobacter shibae (strain DSM 16493 / NCIMB 14021 / DFL 12) TaxID=398580 RepID=A8LMK4_DINSH|nr:MULTISPECIES: universal stress protein [Dinoroseobacter]ABV93549.1 putative universal stress protein [Dinoroseobacter shibae DFL 12 = DSM 16493]MDD9715351.1 universal stress protein [Dinoroseobacter sp. PD6]URF48460.1 universal stress protein [Dinoroseobacter shibae]URF52770.1 universal stress protein [Dinoroseobacter shibae]
MTSKIVVGLDGSQSGERALTYAQGLAQRLESCEIIVAFIIEWSPYTFQTAEENAQRHKRREEEISTARARVVDPAVKALSAAGFAATGVVRHGDVADLLDKIAKKDGAEQIVVARSSEGGFVNRVFGTSTVNLVLHASVPVTVVP